jgi:Prp8 binding protein
MLYQYFLLVSDFWGVYGECENFAVLKGHTGAVMELHFATDGT